MHGVGMLLHGVSMLLHATEKWYSWTKKFKYFYYPTSAASGVIEIRKLFLTISFTLWYNKMNKRLIFPQNYVYIMIGKRAVDGA